MYACELIADTSSKGGVLIRDSSHSYRQRPPLGVDYRAVNCTGPETVVSWPILPSD